MTTNWYSYPPYTNASEASEPGGIFPSLVKHAISYCCRTCQEWGGESYVDFETTFDGHSSMKLDETTVKRHVEDEADISFPLYGFKIQDMYKNSFPYTPFVESPGMVFVVIQEEQETVIKALILTIFQTWPVVLLTLVLAILSGAIIWALVRKLS